MKSTDERMDAVLGLMGSVFSGRPALGYIVVGLLGIALGAAVAVLAYRLSRTRGSGAGPDDEGRGA